MLQEQRLSAKKQTTETVAEQSEMPYHYEFKEGSDEVNVSLHKDMKDLHKTSQSSLVDMYKDQLQQPNRKKKKKMMMLPPHCLRPIKMPSMRSKSCMV